MASARPAVPADTPVLAALHAAAVAEKRDQRGGDLWAVHDAQPGPPVAPSEGAGAGDEDTLVLAGEFAGAVVGYARARAVGLADGRRLAVIDELYVEPDGREVGVGECLMDALLAWAEGLGCCGIDAVALPGDRATKNFFEAHGLIARSITVHRPLGARPGPETA